MNFVVVKSPSLYNGIIGRPRVRKLQAVLSTAHRMLKILVEGGVITLKSSRTVPLECVMVSGPEGNPPATKQAVEERVKVAINPEYPEQTIMIGSTLTEEGRNKMCGLLQRNLDIFAWKPADMTDVPRYIVEYRLNVREGCSPVRQKKWGQAADRNQAIHKEVRKLVKARIMKKVHYHDWLSNPVMVKKHDDSWRMCVDFKDLNKACPKDGYLLPEIDWKVESLCGFPFKDIEETFKTLREINMKLNPKKCTFGVEEGMFLGYKVNTKGLKKSDFHWTAEAEEAFKQMKQLIAELPMLTMEKEELIVYLAAAKETVSAVLMTEREAKQMPIYFVSRALRGPELNYTSMEKLVLALVHANKRLKRYFQAHPIIVIMDQPIQQVLSTPEVAERFDAINNEAKYEALIAGLRITEQMGVKNLQANVDSRLVANQVNGTFAYLSKQVLVEELKEKSISEVEILAVVEEDRDTWMTLIFKYLAEGIQPIDVKKARAIRRKSWRFAIINGTLYKKSFLRPWLRTTSSADSDSPKRLFRTMENSFETIHLRIGAKNCVSAKHPQTNGLVERENHSLGEGIIERLDARRKNWMEELPHVLWAHRTMIKSSNGDTPFSLTYGTKAVIPAEIGMPTLRTAEVDL
ncbi:reverse transcriptase domain-containing protein [Tanacetum coccineum]